MLSKLHSVALVGIEAVPCEIEVNVAGRGFSGPTIVGLPDTAIKESIHRIRTALNNCGYPFPHSTTVINLAPADLKKEGPAFDLPIALGLIFADGQVTTERHREYLILGELALDGGIRPIKGALSAALLAKEQGFKGLVVPVGNAKEAAVTNDVEVIPVASITEAVGFLNGELPIEPTAINAESLLEELGRYDIDYSDVRGQEHAKRAITIAAAGGHNLLLVGPPGSGKTMLSRRLPTILPPMTLEESLETTRIYSAAGQLPVGQALLATRPFRTPHHTASGPALVGGGTIPQAGEVSLSHHGVLFLDEFPEFSRAILETLRQPMEDGVVTIARAYGSVQFPARFMLVAAMNPCPCGYFTDPNKPCKCSPTQIDKYLARISGPLIDRIDMHVEVPVVPYRDLRSTAEGSSTATMREKVLSARRVQRERFGAKATMTNSRMNTRDIRKYCRLDGPCEALLKQAMTQLGLSARAHDKILKISRTIADIEGHAELRPEHLSEAIHYRRLDRQL